MIALAAALAAAAAWLTVRGPLRSPPAWARVRRLLDALRRRMLSRRRRTQMRAALRESLAEVVADVRAGQPPERALTRALADRDAGLAPRTLAVARWGGDIVGALRDDARVTAQPILGSAGKSNRPALTRPHAADHGATALRRATRLRRIRRRAGIVGPPRRYRSGICAPETPPSPECESDGNRG